MDIPEIFNQNLEKNIITEDMLGAALFSLNKRAKNYRDEKRKAKKACMQKQNCSGLIYLKILQKQNRWKKKCI